MRPILFILFINLFFFTQAFSHAEETHSILDFISPSTSDEIQDWAPVLEKALTEIPEGGEIYFPGNRQYVFLSTVSLKRSLSFRFASSAVLLGKNIPALFSIHSGNWFSFQGVNNSPLLEVSEKGSVIDLTKLQPDATPDLTVQNLSFRANAAIAGSAGKYEESAGSLGNVLIRDCHFQTTWTAIAFNQGSIKSIKISDCLFEGETWKTIFIACPVQNAVEISSNQLLDVGRTAIQVGGGKAGMIDDGALDHVNSVVIQNNQILGGGRKANESSSYIHGILVYGRNVSIQGNVVRDFHRGEPVTPGKPGHHFLLKDGTWHRGPWLYPDGSPRKRLAGAAIYAKAQFGTIANNVCTNSGWRAVIEVKTGGRQPYFLVTGNMIDGSSLAIDESFGFEADTAKAVWSNNLIINMPNMAFKSHAGNGTNTFMNNVIIDSKTGFSAYNHPDNPDRTWLSNNRFINVETPVLIPNAKGNAIDISLPPLFIPPGGSLPPADESQWGRFAFFAGKPDHENQIFVVKKIDKEFKWVEFQDVPQHTDVR